MSSPCPPLDSLSDDALLVRLTELLGCSRRVEGELVAHLAEVDARRLYLREACPSMHAYATERLHLSDAEAYLRITVARLSRRFPMVLEMLADGRLHLSGAARLAPHLRDSNGAEVLARAAHRSKRAIEELVAGLAPRPDAPSSMRRLPVRGTSSAISIPPDDGDPARRSAIFAQPAAGPVAPAVAARKAEPVAAVSPACAALSPACAGASPACAAASPAGAVTTSTTAELAAPISGAASARAAVLVPTSPGRYKIQFTAGAELHDKLLRARALLRRDLPDGDLAVIVDRAVTLLLRELERRRFAATNKPRKTAVDVDPTPSSRHIPAAARRAVWSRDGGQCTFHDRHGRRCAARERLEFHHVVPFARGGDHSETTLRLMCSRHNQFQAELDYGADFIAARRSARAGASATSASAGQSQLSSTWS
jgi:5-methylcytosine-specific restriction endonuclease McrA